MAKLEKIFLEEEMVSILEQCGPALTNVLYSKFGCTAVLHGVATGAGKFKKPGEERFSTQLSKGLKVSVWKDDLTTHKVDAVVNAANVNLSHGGGLAGALCDAGGPDIQRESDQYTKLHGKLLTGNAIVAKPGRLPCKKIIHAVGPCLPYKPTRYEVDAAIPELSKTVMSVLKMVEQETLQSVAIPAISSGLFNFPLPLCANVIVQTLKNYHDRYYSGAPLEVRLVNHDELTVREMERACSQFLGFSGSHSQAAAAQRQAPYSQNVTSYGKGSTKPLTPTVQLGNVSLNIKKGHIEEEKVDVIVNTTQQDLKLAVGEISKAISQKAGHEMQIEIVKDNDIVCTGDVIETKGYKLNCSSVYHTVCARRDEPSADEILYDVVFKCLRKAAASGRRSIAFPAIGTGNLRFQKQEVAKIMTDAVVVAAQNLQEMRMDIYVVVYPSDKDTFQAFERQLKSHQYPMKYPSSSNSASSQGFGHATDRSRSPTPHIELSSAHSDTLREATFWLTHAFFLPSNNFTIHNNFIQCFGQTEFDELLSLQTKWKVSIQENLKDGCASVTIQGAYRGVRAAVLEVEAMCCKVQEDFAKELENMMGLTSPTSSPRKPVDDNSLECKEIKQTFSGFQIVRVEKVENRALRQLFDLKKKQLQVSTSPQRMYQRLPVQFCDLLSRVGFQREFAPPDEQKLGEGIYFSSSVSGAEKLWLKSLADEEYMYFVEAEVLTGKSTGGSPDLIVAPPFGRDPLTLYDSVEDGLATFVIFNGHQALPKYLITCKKPSSSFM